MNIEDIQWTYTCCGEACRYAEVEVASGWLQVKTSHDDDDLSYAVRSYNANKVAVDTNYVSVTEEELVAMLAS